MQSTSLQAYKTDILPTLSTRKQAVLKAMEYRENWTIAELTNYLGWPVNSLTGRLDDLEKEGAIEVIGGRHYDPVKRICKATGRMAMQWRIKKDQPSLF